MATNKLDVLEIVEKAVKKILKDEKLQKQFLDEPVKDLEKVLDVDLPDELLEPVIDGIKTKIKADQVADTLKDASKLFKKLF